MGYSRDMNPLLPSSRPQTHEQLQKYPIPNPRSRFLAQFGTIIQALLSQIHYNDGKSYYWESIWGKSPQIPNLLRASNDDGERNLIREITQGNKWFDGKSLPLQRRRRKKRRGLSLVEPRSLWRLGLGAQRCRMSCCNLVRLGTMVRRRIVRVSRERSQVKEIWEGFSSPLWNGLKERRTSRSQRSYYYPIYLAHFELSNLIPMCRIIGNKLKHWGAEPSISDEKSYNEQYDYMNNQEQPKPMPTMVEETLKSSATKNKGSFGRSKKGTEQFWEQLPLEEDIEQLEPLPTMVVITLKSGKEMNKANNSPVGTNKDHENGQLNLKPAMLMKIVDHNYIVLPKYWNYMRLQFEFSAMDDECIGGSSEDEWKYSKRKLETYLRCEQLPFGDTCIGRPREDECEYSKRKPVAYLKWSCTLDSLTVKTPAFRLKTPSGFLRRLYYQDRLHISYSTASPTSSPASSSLALVGVGLDLQFQFNPKPRFTVRIGRIVRGNTIKDDGISTKHLSIEWCSEANRTDLDSSNGTLLNSAALPPFIYRGLRDGDVLKIGEVTSIRVSILGAEAQKSGI